MEDYSSIIGEVIPEYASFFFHELNEINNNNFEITQSPLSISVSATQRIADSFKELKVAKDFPDAIASLLKQAEKKGLSGRELAAIIKIIEAGDH